MSDVAVAADAIPASRTVLTSESAPAFYANKLGLVEPAAADSEPAEAANAADEGKENAAAVESPADAEGKKDGGKEADGQQTESDPEKKQKLNARFSDLTKQRDEAMAKAEAAEAARVAAEQRAAELQAKYEKPEPDELGPRPQRAQFDTQEDFELALEDYAGEKREREVKAKEAETRTVDAFRDRLAAFRPSAPDYDEALNGSNVVLGNEVRDAILDSETGPQILYHLAKNPDVATRWRTMKVPQVLREVGKLEAKLGDAPKGAAEPAKKSVAAATEVSRAPAPISPIKGSGSSVAGASVDSKGEFIGTFADYKAQRAAGKIK